MSEISYIWGSSDSLALIWKALCVICQVSCVMCGIMTPHGGRTHAQSVRKYLHSGEQCCFGPEQEGVHFLPLCHTFHY